jgi:ankyrin repeat protein
VHPEKLTSSWTKFRGAGQDKKHSKREELPGMSIFNEIYNRSEAEGNRIVCAYVKSGYDVNAKHYNGKSLLFAAASMGLADGVRKLIAAGADINTAHDGYTPLLVALGNGEFEVCKVLIQAKADVNLRVTRSGQSALSLAAERGLKDIVLLLLRAKADIGSTDNKGLTALDHATRNGHAEVVELLTMARKPRWKFW